MEPHTCLTLVFFVLVNLAVGVLSTDDYSRHDFPVDFVFGSGTSAYQVEGAANEDGRTPSIWDTFAHAGFARGGNGDVACDTYHRYKEDVQLMVETGLDAYRFSISWSRLIPNGRGPINPKGLQYYNNLINELIRNGIQPHVTLHNYDLPQALEDEYGGWLSREVIKDFTNYADVCFREFGDRVKYWTTVNEPNIFAVGSYDQGISPPQRCSPPFCLIESTKGNSTFEPYLVVHHILLAHSSAVRLYRRKYRVYRLIFFHTVYFSLYFLFCFVTVTLLSRDLLHCRRNKMDLLVSHSIHLGQFHKQIQRKTGQHVNDFAIFIWVDNSDVLNTELRDFSADAAAKLLGLEEVLGENEYPFTPWALGQVLDTFKTLYGNPPIFIHENGQRTLSNASLHDESRLKYLHGYIGAVLDSLRNGSNMKGYFVWSFMDAFELLDGYESIYGLYYVDRNDPELRRYPKLSAKWYAQFLKGTRSSLVGAIELNNDSSLVSVGHLLQ